MADPDDFFAKRIVYRVAGMDRVQVRRDLVYKRNPELRFDLYLPESASSEDRIPVVVLVHGDGHSYRQQRRPRRCLVRRHRAVWVPVGEAPVQR
jgi:hypothetical protein